ncbi:unnamed protein product [Blepharisma stoltei]|uniref:Uncharacterized protein n=1 Tax=Blepharisma stoltei TaxID=1481888 RepID=A0AAU9JGX8_9CILI|nr:unnamed protein product [Blepharisma stoltei]
MIMFRFSRFFSTYRQPRPHIDINSSLSILRDPNSYTTNTSSVIRALSDLGRSTQLYQNKNIEWSSKPEIVSASKSIPAIIDNLDLESSVALIKCCGQLGMDNNDLWNAIERKIILKHYKTIKSSEASEIVTALQKLRKGSARVWNCLESTIITKFCEKNEITAKEATDILVAYRKSEHGSEQLVQSLEQQLIRNASQINSYDIWKIMLVYGQLNLGSDEFYARLETQIKAICSTFNTLGAVITLDTYIRQAKGSQELYQSLENEISHRLKAELNLENISSLMYTYAMNFTKESQNIENRKNFIKDLETILCERYSSIAHEKARERDYNIGKCAWAISKLDMPTDLRLWNIIFKEMKEKGWESNEKFIFFMREIKPYLKRNSLI